jgi:hypothetical protein
VDPDYGTRGTDDEGLKRIRRELESMKRRSTEVGAPIVERLAAAAEALIPATPPPTEAGREVLDAVGRSLELMALLLDDASRRSQGYPPAALHEAVYVLLEHLERISPFAATPSS